MTAALPQEPSARHLASQSRTSQQPVSLPLLAGQGCAVRYSAGALDRAHHVLLRLEVLTHYFRKWSDVPMPLAAYVLTREDWESIGFVRPYGLPARTGSAGVAVAAAGDEGTVTLWRRLLATQKLPMVPGMPIRGTPEEAASLALADVLLQVEAARGFIARVDLVAAAPWMAEVLAHLAALTIFDLQEKPRQGEIGAMYERLSRRGDPPALPVAVYRPDLPLDEWLWFQAQFHRGARLLLEKDGKKAMQRLLKLHGKKGKRLDPSWLVELYPGLGQWLDSSFLQDATPEPDP